MSILIVGSDGNMGSRYKAVLNYLNVSWVGVDKHDSKWDIKSKASQCAGVIIATPTDTHLELLRLLNHTGKPIMCEKPLSKAVVDLAKVLDEFEQSETPLNMIYQYRELANERASGPTEYNYFKHGGDGLAWDCIQIIGLANEDIKLREESPYWWCLINGERLDLSRMDMAYVEHIRKWLKNPGDDLQELLDIHLKTEEISRSERRG